MTPGDLAIEKLAVISFFVIGISHIVQPRAWVQFFVAVRNKGETGSLINAFIHFPLGALIVGFHNVWHGIPTVLTVMGWGWVLKGFIYFTFPKFGLKAMQRVSLERSHEFVIAGVVLIALGGLLLYSIVAAHPR